MERRKSPYVKKHLDYKNYNKINGVFKQLESILQNLLNLLNDAMGYLRLFVIGGTAFFVAKDYALKMASSDDNQKASYDRKIRNTIIAGVSALVTTQFVAWVLGYFK